MTALFTLVFGLAAGWWIERRRHQTIEEQAFWDEAKTRAMAQAADRLYDQREAASRAVNRLRDLVCRQNAYINGRRT